MSADESDATDSFRGYLERLEKRGACNRIDHQISWNLETGAVTMRANERDSAIPVFEDVSDESEARLVGDPYRGSRQQPWGRVATGLGLSDDLTTDGFYEEIIDRLRSPVAPTVVEDDAAPCKQVVHSGEDVDLLSFPWPFLHVGDGGRYSNLHTLIADDRDTEWTDWSSHRTMFHDNTRASVLLLAGEQTPNIYYYKYERHDEPMPVALAIGAEPAVECVSMMWIPTGRNEADFAGGLKRAPVELVPCETNDLLVPATAEIVLEGRILPNSRLDEGPYGDYFGYMHGPRRSMPVLEIDAITHRDQPYIPFTVEWSEVGYAHNTTSSMEVACVGPDATLGLRAAGFDVEKLAPWPFTPRTVYVISTDTTRPSYLHELANFIFTTWGMLHVDFFVFVDSDVDPFDQCTVLEAMALYADPDEDFHQFGTETMPKVPLNIYQTPEEKGDVQMGTSKAKTAKTYIDATRPEGVEHINRSESENRRERAREILDDAGLSAEIFEKPSVSREGEN
ncbi:UbiD family decarboxylase [Halomicroarcula sp. F13]|uniref:UbiD family decarboxylase n=1 Tax=Haloarcula rubra TaxID=2487747 RepID=A0AAW4PVT9_9EURY|nr:UbiD family decarboxylase [Halomicroarcula rubra]MBX0325311.1 UbiD family decarboxylase [Halomicroarcula rubra]